MNYKPESHIHIPRNNRSQISNISKSTFNLQHYRCGIVCSWSRCPIIWIWK